MVGARRLNCAASISRRVGRSARLNSTQLGGGSTRLGAGSETRSARRLARAINKQSGRRDRASRREGRFAGAEIISGPPASPIDHGRSRMMIFSQNLTSAASMSSLELDLELDRRLGNSRRGRKGSFFAPLVARPFARRTGGGGGRWRPRQVLGSARQQLPAERASSLFAIIIDHLAGPKSAFSRSNGLLLPPRPPPPPPSLLASQRT